MKKTYLLVVILFSMQTGFTQNISDTAVIYDFLNLSQKLDVDLKKCRGSFAITINNVNRNIFEVSNSKSEENYNIQVPSVLQGIKFPSYFNLAGSSKLEIKKRELINFEKSTGHSSREGLTSVINYLNLAIDANNELVCLLNSCDLSLTQINTRKAEILNLLAEGDDIEGFERQGLKEKINRKIALGLNLGRDILKNDSDLSTEFKDSLKNTLKEINDFKLDNKVTVLISNLNKINKNTFTFRISIDKIKKDETNFKITTKTKQAIPCDLPWEREFNVKIIKSCGFKMDFSSGLFCNFGNSIFRDDKLFKNEITDSTFQISTVNAGKRIIPGIGALLHFHLRTPYLISPAISLGVSTTSGFDALNFHAGLSGIIGSHERVIFTVGLTAREVSKLDNRYNTFTTYNKTKFPDEIPTSKIFPYWGGFVSLTYNIYQFATK